MTAISCLSLISPVGYCAASTAAAVRASIAAFAALPYRDINGEPIRGASIEAIPGEIRGRDRLAALARLAIDQVDPSLGDQLPWGDMPLILCAREPEAQGARMNGILSDLRYRNGAPIAGGRSGHIAAGQISAFAAIEQSRKILRESSVEGCLIMAIDSLIDARALNWLDQHKRLKTSDQTDGVIPGEAACLSLVTRQALFDSRVTVRGLGLAMETATVLSDEPSRADGLTQALRLALQEAGVAMHDVDWRLSDVAGESFAFEELALAQMRLVRRVRAEQLVWLAADCMGDCGAAAGLIQFAIAEQAFTRGYAPRTIAALHGSSLHGGRAAAIITH